MAFITLLFRCYCADSYNRDFTNWNGPFNGTEVWYLFIIITENQPWFTYYCTSTKIHCNQSGYTIFHGVNKMTLIYWFKYDVWFISVISLNVVWPQVIRLTQSSLPMALLACQRNSACWLAGTNLGGAQRPVPSWQGWVLAADRWRRSQCHPLSYWTSCRSRRKRQSNTAHTGSGQTSCRMDTPTQTDKQTNTQATGQ